METAVKIYQAIPSDLWALIAASVVSPTVLWIKHKSGDFLKNKPWLVMILVALTSLAPALGAYILTVGQGSTNLKLIAFHTMVIGVVSQPIYFGVVRTLYLRWCANLAAQADLSEQAKSAIVPAQGLPAVGTKIIPTYADDFAK